MALRAIKKPHPADIRDAARIAAAVRYAVHFRKSPHETFNESAATLAEAQAIKQRLDAAHGQHGRRAMIYAISSSGIATPIG